MEEVGLTGNFLGRQDRQMGEKQHYSKKEDSRHNYYRNDSNRTTI